MALAPPPIATGTTTPTASGLYTSVLLEVEATFAGARRQVRWFEGTLTGDDLWISRIDEVLDEPVDALAALEAAAGVDIEVVITDVAGNQALAR